MVRKREPERRDFPAALECVFCGATLKRHCKRCAWYPCKANKVNTRVVGFTRAEDGSITWVVTHRSIPLDLFSLK